MYNIIYNVLYNFDPFLFLSFQFNFLCVVSNSIQIL